MSRQLPQLPLPDDWEPEEIWHVRVPIPGGSDYLAVLAGWLHGLTYSANHDRDETKTGAATVSRTWQRALGSRPIERCDLELRQNPYNPCILEFNDGEGWQQFADTSSCKMSSPPLSVPFPDGATDDERMDYVATLVSQMGNMFYYMNTSSTAPQLRGNWINATNITRIYTQQNINDLAYGLAAIAPDAPPGELAALKTPSSDFWRAFAQAIVCTLDPSGRWNDNVEEIALSAIEGFGEWSYAALETVLEISPSSAFEAAAQNLGGYTFSRSAVFPDPVECNYCIRYDFSVGQQGWLVDTAEGYIPAEAAVYIPGTGFGGVWQVPDGPGYPAGSCFIYIDFGQEINLVRMRMHCQIADGPFQPDQGVAFRDGRFNGGDVFFAAPLNPGVQTYEWEAFEGVARQLSVLSAQHACAEMEDVGQMFTYWIEIEGMGINPPAGGSPCP